MIVRLGREHHPDHPYDNPRVNVVTDDARHFLRTTPKRYDLVVFALIDSLTLQSSFTSVRLESYMFTEESFRAVKDRLKPGGVLVIYNYFRERWLVDRLANTAAVAFGTEPRVHIHKGTATRRADGGAGPQPDQSDTVAARSRRGLQPPRRDQSGRAAGARRRRGDFLQQHVERFRHAGIHPEVAVDDVLVHLGPSGDVV